MNPYCEPHLTKRNLQQTIGSLRDRKIDIDAIKWLLNFSDGFHDIKSIAKKSGININFLKKKAKSCCKLGLLKKL